MYLRSVKHILQIFLFGIFFLAFYNTGSCQEYYYEVNTIPLKGELSNFMGRCMLQDKEGFIWFGSEDGLYRYDGNGFQVFTNDPWDTTTLSCDIITNIREAQDGSIWITTKRGLNRFNKRTESFARFLPVPGDSTSLLYPNIRQITVMKNGLICLASLDGFSIMDPGSETFRNFVITRSDDAVSSASVEIWGCYADTDQNLVLETDNGHYKYYFSGDSIEYLGNLKLILSREHYPDFSIDKSGRFIVNETDSLKIKQIKHLLEDPHSGDLLNAVYHIIARLKDVYGNYWIRTLMGLGIYNSNLRLLYFTAHNEPYKSTPEYWFSNFMVPDRQGSVWYFTRDGIQQVMRKEKLFKVHDPDSWGQSYFFDLFADSRDSVWAAGLDGLYLFNRNLQQFTLQFGDGMNRAGHPYETTAIYTDSRDILWIGSTHNGLLRLNNHDDPENKFMKYTESSPGDRPSRELIYIHNLFEDSDNRLWIGLANQMDCYYDLKENKIFRLEPNPGADDHIDEYTIVRHELSNRVLLAMGLGAGNGLLYKLVPPFIQISDNAVMPSNVIKCSGIDESGLAVNIPEVRTSLIDSSGNLWLGTVDFGIMKIVGIDNAKPSDNTFRITTYTTADGLPNNNINLISEYRKGQLWIGTENGLAHFNTRTGIFKNYFMRHGLSSNFIRSRSAIVLKNGEMMVGTRDGIVSFYPDSLKYDKLPDPVRITSISVNNQELSPLNNPWMDQSILWTNKIELPYDHNNISLSFALLNYIDPELNQYRYRLQGLEKDWIYTEKRTRVDYTNLDHGRYLFRVIAADSKGVWNEEGASLAITIRPPPWQTWYAYFLYVLVAAGITLIVIRYLRNRSKMRMAIEIERVKKEKVLEVDRLKSRFFMNISHEFRTPLSLITGPLESALHIPGKQVKMDRGEAEMVDRNARRLGTLINQLLDISKLESGTDRMKVEHGNLGEFVQSVFSNFLSLAESRNIRYHLTLPETGMLSWFDRDKIEKILVNLINNAFKFTDPEGSINVALQYQADPASENLFLAVLTISDSGKGIPPEKTERIFDRFYQADHSDTRTHEGTGIGLALVRELVDLYRGRISVESEYGRGTAFRVELPVSKVHFQDEECIVPLESTLGKSSTAGGEGAGTETDTKTDTETDPGTGAGTGPGKDTVAGAGPGTKPGEGIAPVTGAGRVTEAGAGAGMRKADGTVDPPADANTGASAASRILVVEDNPDLRTYISSLLEEENHVITAENGKAGLELARSHLPDLVISDLMMPVMSGTEMTAKIKQDTATNHIPVIMLTAKADKESKLEGLELGADDYLIKPFDKEELQVRARNLIRQRAKLREKFAQDFLLASETEEGAFHFHALKGILDIIHQHLDDVNFNMNAFGRELHMTRSQLFRKIRSVTNTTPNELVRIVRMRRAARLLRSTDLNVTQVMYEVGMKNPSHFAKSFKKYYKMNPAKYRKA